MHSIIDRRHFLADLSEITNRIRELKGLLGARWERAMAAEQRELVRLKWRATELCSLCAFTRGKLHFCRGTSEGSRNESLEYHRRIAERLAPVYSLGLEQSA